MKSKHFKRWSFYWRTASAVARRFGERRRRGWDSKSCPKAGPRPGEWVLHAHPPAQSFIPIASGQNFSCGEGGIPLAPTRAWALRALAPFESHRKTNPCLAPLAQNIFAALIILRCFLIDVRTFFEENPEWLRASRAKPKRSGGQKGRGLGGRNFCPPSLSAAAEFRANKVGAPPFMFLTLYKLYQIV
jgi:hypothetical protein